MDRVCAINGTLVPEVNYDYDMSDLYNELNTRNDNNTITYTYNCGGYALETYNWFLPVPLASHIEEASMAAWLQEKGYNDWFEYIQEHGCNCEEDDECQYRVGCETDNGLEYLYDLLSEIHDNATDEEMDDLENLYYHHRYDTDIAVELAVLNMLKSFPDLRRIHDFTELRPDEYGIAYCGSDWDFHFAKYDQYSDTLSHKLGPEDIECVDTFEKAFDENGYNSKIAYFAKKRRAC